MQEFIAPLKGRGSHENPSNRFETLRYERNEDDCPEENPGPKTQFFRDNTKSFITYNDSPDINFDASINPYRGCEHGCFYCYARPYHEYLGLSAGLDFETKIFVKENAPALLRKELNAKSWKPQPLGLSGVTDPYQPIERKLQLTRGCLEVLVEFRNPVMIVTKNHLVARDRDLLAELAKHQAVSVMLGITTLDAELAGIMEPRASRPQGRLDAIRELAEVGVPVGVLVAPVIPGLTDHEMPAIMHEARTAGATMAGFTMLRLPHGVGDLVESWLSQHFPDRKDKVLGRIREVRSGKRNDSNFGSRMRGEGPLAEMTNQMFQLAYRKEGFSAGKPMSVAAFRRPDETPTLLFDEHAEL